MTPVPPAGRDGSARLAVLAAAVLFSTGGAAIKASSLSGWQVAFLRSCVAAVALALFCPRSLRAGGWRAAAGGAAYSVVILLFVLANKLTTAANAIFLQSASPFYLLLLAPWLLKERVRGRDVALILVMAAGMGLCLAGSPPAAATAPNPALGNALGAAAAVAWAVTLIGLRSLAGGQDSGDKALGMVVWGNIIAGLVAAPFAFPVGAMPARDWLVIGYLGVFQIALAYVCLTAGMRRVPALEASLLLLVEPVLNPVWAWLAHGEDPGAWSIAGGALILAAAAVQTLLGSAARRAAGPKADGTQVRCPGQPV